jgi:hypothetical protein
MTKETAQPVQEPTLKEQLNKAEAAWVKAEAEWYKAIAAWDKSQVEIARMRKIMEKNT